MSEIRAIGVNLREMSPELAVILDNYLPLELRGKPVILIVYHFQRKKASGNPFF